MTNRDPNVPDFIRKTNDFYDCYKNYFKISNEEKLRNDLLKKDINLVCAYERLELVKHTRKNKGIHFNDLIKLPNLRVENEFLKKFDVDS